MGDLKNAGFWIIKFGIIWKNLTFFGFKITTKSRSTRRRIIQCLVKLNCENGRDICSVVITNPKPKTQKVLGTFGSIFLPEQKTIFFKNKFQLKRHFFRAAQMVKITQSLRQTATSQISENAKESRLRPTPPVLNRSGKPVLTIKMG
jgi:hypothetical protein